MAIAILKQSSFEKIAEFSKSHFLIMKQEHCDEFYEFYALF